MQEIKQIEIYMQYNLGVSYRDGTGVAQSNATARKWFMKSALLSLTEPEVGGLSNKGKEALAEKKIWMKD